MHKSEPKKNTNTLPFPPTTPEEQEKWDKAKKGATGIEIEGGLPPAPPATPKPRDPNRTPNGSRKV